MSFRQKILISQCVLLLAIITVLLPSIDTVSSYILKQVYNSPLQDPAYSFEQMKKVFNLTILCVSILLLVVNGILIMVIIHRVMSPVQQIINAVRSYKEGKEEFLPRIVLKEPVQAGELSKLVSTINSLSDQIQKQLEFYARQKEEKEEVLESLGEGILAADPSAKIIFANQSACRMLGVFREQILGGALNGFEETEILKKCHELLLQALQTLEPVSYTWIVRDKGTFYYDLIASPLAHKDGALLVLQDKTSDYRIVQLGKDFIANASHELRTPITIIRGFAETLQDLPELSKEMLHEITGKIVKTCGRLDNLVHSLLTLTDIEQMTTQEFVKVDLLFLLENCIEMIRSVHPTAIVRFHSELTSANVSAEAALLELAVMNILENAIRYSGEPAEIDISLLSMPTEYQIQFQDRGIGISEQELSHIFERFYTVDKARSRKKGGAGLGLSIVKTILEKHRGRITVSSELGKGTLFTFAIPKMS